MNLRQLRNDLAADIRIVCKDFVLKKPLSDEESHFIESGLSVFEQNEPPPRMDTEGLIHPYIVVKATGGSVQGEDLEVGNITLVIATWDDNDLSGEDDLLSIIERIKNHYLAMPILSKMFYCQRDMSYELADEQPKPYWYATITMSWEIPKMNIMAGAEYV